jgi:hypothetical protein
MASKINDEFLRNQALILKDPYSQKGLIWEIPNSAVLLDIINIYKFERWPTEKVYCCLCKGRHHKMGFTALLASGERLLLGSKCGAKLFRESWTEAATRMEERADRQYELIKLDRLDLIARPFRESLLGWLRAMETILNRRIAFENRLGELASRTREAANNHGGALTVSRRIENKAARAAGLRDLGDHVDVKVGDLSGSAFFNRFNPKRAVEQALNAFDKMRLGIGDTDNAWTSVLTKRRRDFERTFSDLEQAAQMYEGAQEFFSLENFRVLLDWSNKHRATVARYEIGSDGIVKDEEKAGGIMLLTLAPLDETPLDLLKEYRRAD